MDFGRLDVFAIEFKESADTSCLASLSLHLFIHKRVPMTTGFRGCRRCWESEIVMLAPHLTSPVGGRGVARLRSRTGRRPESLFYPAISH